MDLRLYEKADDYLNIEGWDRFAFPEKIVRVTAGAGGEAMLIFGSEKTALIDCGMAYCAEDLIYNIHVVFLNEYEMHGNVRTLDYIFMTHTHYDHIGALAAVKREWPKAVTCASEYAKKVFQREGAVKLIQHLSNTAARSYSDNCDIEIPFEYMQVDRVLHEGDRISLGEESVCVLETPGHTNCSLSFALEPEKVLFLSESTGVVQSENRVESAILKSYSDALASIRKCREYDARRMIVPHTGIIPASYHEKFWFLLMKNMQEKWDFARERYEKMTEEEIVEDYIKAYWEPKREEEQPFEAFCENAKHEVHAVLEDIEKGFSGEHKKC